MSRIRYRMATLLAVVALLACTAEQPTTEDHVLKGQVQSMEKARQVEGVMQERVDALDQKLQDGQVKQGSQ